MKKYRWIAAGIVACLAIAAVSYFWATSLMDSLYAYRSPLAERPPAAGSPVGAPLAHRVVTILVDGLRVDTAADAGVMPFLNSLRAQGAAATVQSGLPSYSAPSWSVLATGAWQDLSDGPAMNPNSPGEYLTWTQDNIFTAARAAGRRTAVAANSYFQYLIPPQTYDAAAWTYEESAAADQQNASAAAAFIQSGKYDYIFTYSVQVDYSGHYEGGPLDPNWKAAASRADGLIEQVVGAMDLEQDVVLIYSDHGQIDAGGHGGQDAAVRVQPFIMAGAGVKPGSYGDIQQVDIAPTTAFLLGASLPAISQGRVLTEMLSLDALQQAALREAAITQQQGLYQAYAAALGAQAEEITPAADQDPVTVFQAALDRLKQDRLNRERALRFLFILPLGLIPPYLFLRMPRRQQLWGLLAVAVYLAAFHLQYGVLGGGTYTLSSVLSASDLIAATARAGAIAFAAAWLAAALGLGLFAQPRLQALHGHLTLTFTVLYAAALPALWSLGTNGALVGWTLPDIPSMFVGFLFILQLLFIAAASLPLMGITALLARRAGAG